MADKLASPLILHNCPSTKPIFPVKLTYHPTASSSSQPLPSAVATPLLCGPLQHQQDLAVNAVDALEPLGASQSSVRVPWTRIRLGKSVDLNRGRPWSHRSLSSQGQHFIEHLVDPQFDASKIEDALLELTESYRKEGVLTLKFLGAEILGIVQGLGFYQKCGLAVAVIEWVRNHKNFAQALNGSILAAVIKLLGKKGEVSAAASLLKSFQKDGLEINVYAYTSLISAFANNGRYRDAVEVFKEMEEDGCRPTVITYNVILYVYGKMGMPWNRIVELYDSMQNSGVVPDSYTYNTLIACCRRGSLYEKAAAFFQEMKSAGIEPDKVTYNALLDVYGKSRRLKEAIEVKNEMELNGISPSIVSYNSLISPTSL